MKTIMIITILILGITASAQDSTSNSFIISGYVEGYYTFDFNKPENNIRPSFLYHYNRHNEFNLNLGFLKAAYAKERVRANLAVAAGTYINANYAAEPGTLKNILEANAGYKLSAKNNWWLDIGILPSHIGFESAIGKDNWSLTRSIVAENSPYFESGIRLSYISPDGKLLLAGLMLNGWQRITRVTGNSLMSYGTQVYYKPATNITFNYSTFIGTDEPDSNRLWRYYHNFYSIIQFSDKIGLIAGFDFGSEQKTINGSKYNTWYTPVGIFRFTPTSKWTIALRGEYFSDENGVVISTGTPNGFKTSSASLNIDYLPQPNLALRLEGKTFKSKDPIFVKGTQSKSSNTAISFSTALSF